MYYKNFLTILVIIICVIFFVALGYGISKQADDTSSSELGVAFYRVSQGGLGTSTIPSLGDVPCGDDNHQYGVCNFVAGSNITIATTSPSDGQGSITISSTASGTGDFAWTPIGGDNSTSTRLRFGNGFISQASSTIGNGTDTGGLTINGGATSTGDVFITDGNGLVVGHNAFVTLGLEHPFQVLGTGIADAVGVFGRWSNGTGAPRIEFLKSRGAAIGDIAVVQNNDILSEIRFHVDDGVDYATQAAVMSVEVDDSSPAENDVGAAFVWQSLPGGGDTTLNEVMRIAADGLLTIPNGFISNASSTLSQLLNWRVATGTQLTLTDLFISDDQISDFAGTGLTVTGGALNCDTATAGAQGCVTSGDWVRFNESIASSSLNTYAELNALVADVTLTHNGLIDTFSELDTIVADKSLANLNDAQTFSSLINFTLGFISNGASSTVRNLSLQSMFASSTAIVDGRAVFAERVGIASTSPVSSLGVAGTTTTNTLNVDNPNHTASGTLYIYSDTASFGGEIILEDSDGAGCSVINALNGVLTAVTITCPARPLGQ